MLLEHPAVVAVIVALQDVLQKTRLYHCKRHRMHERVVLLLPEQVVEELVFVLISEDHHRS